MTAPVREGEVLAGKYRVERVLGVGGMGVVVAAHHLQLDEKVALKFLLPEALQNREVVARFAREARAAAKIKSEHIARVTDVGTLENGAPFMVMEYLHGIDLAGVLKQRGAISVEDAAEYVLQACEAIGEAHSLGIVHRDLKPANLFLARRHDGSACVKVLDFGISKVTNALSASDAAMTSTQAMMGSPLYMSPEQMMSAKDVDHRSDVWALGVILYELLAGEPPFNGESIGQLAILISQQQPRAMRDFRPDISLELERVVLHCLEKDRGKRYQNVGELAVALAEFGPKRSRISAERVSRMMQAAGMSGSALVLPPSSDAAPDGDASRTGITAGAWSETRPGAKAGSPALFVAGTAALGLVAGIVWAVTHHEGGPAIATSVAPIAAAPAPVPVAVSQPTLATASPAISAAAPLPATSIPAIPHAAPVELARRMRVAPVGHPAPPEVTPALPKPAALAPAPVAPAPPPPAAPPARSKGFDFGGRN